MHRITVEERMRAVVVTAAGELDAYVAPELTAALDQGDVTLWSPISQPSRSLIRPRSESWCALFVTVA